MAGSIRFVVLLALLMAQTAVARTVHPACDYANAVDQFQSQRHEIAAAAFEKCVIAGKHTPESNFYLGIIARDTGDLEQAQELLSEAVRLSPDTVSYRLEWAVTFEWLGHLNQAKSIYAEVLEFDPNNLPARLGVARLLHWQGRLAPALRTYHDLLREHPGNTAIQSGLAFALLADNRLNESRDLFEQVLSENPDDESAHQGLRMLNDMRVHRLVVQGGQLRDSDGRDISQWRVTYSETPSYALRWGVEAFRGETFATPLQTSGIPVNRAVRSSHGVFADYRLDSTTSVFGSWRQEELADDRNQTKLQAEVMYKPSRFHRLFAGTIPAYIGGERVNTLTYAGYVFESTNNWNAMAQFYHGWDRDFDSSKALSLSWSRTYSKRNYFRVGASFSQTADLSAESVYASGVHYLNRDLAITANLVNNFFTEQSEITLGVIYEF